MPVQGQNVVFTGPAKDQHGTPILRALLIDAAQARGFKVQSSVTAETQVLVASTTGTVKAKRAAWRHIQVLTYPEFLEELNAFKELQRTELTSKTMAPNPYVDGKYSSPAQPLQALESSPTLAALKGYNLWPLATPPEEA